MSILEVIGDACAMVAGVTALLLVLRQVVAENAAREKAKAPKTPR